MIEDDSVSYGSPNSEKINCTSAGVYIRFGINNSTLLDKTRHN